MSDRDARSDRGARGALGCLLIAVLGCAPKSTTVAKPTPAAPAPTAPAPAAPPSVAAASGELPEGPGRQILRTACVSCHSLTEVTKFRGFYTRQQWGDIVQTMVEYGAPVNDKDAEVLTNYLTESLGKK